MSGTIEVFGVRHHCQTSAMTGAHTIWFRGMKLAMGSHARKDGNLAAKCGKGLGLNEPENDWRGTGNGIFARALDNSFNCLLFPASGQLLS